MTPLTLIQCGPITIEWGPGVLEPRPWTFEQARWAHEIIGTADAPILELHCGAGAIGLGAAVLCGASLVQVDDNPTACEWARKNASHLGIHTDVRCATISDALDSNEQFSVVLADPPYLRPEAIASFPDDPKHAIDGGIDGLRGITEVLTVAPRHMRTGASLLLQVGGCEQATDVEDLLARSETPLELQAVRDFGPDRAIALLRRTR